MNVLFTSPVGITFERTDYKNRSKVKVSNRGYNLRTYRFNNVECFESPYISWQNLDQCGGWATRDEYLYTAVQNGTKLFAQIVTFPEPILTLSRPQIESSDDIVITTAKIHPKFHHTHICRKGCLSDYYSLDDVFAHYSRLGISFTVDEKTAIREYCNVELSVFATDEAPFNYLNVHDIESLVVTGLLLGYPLESTASIIEEWGL